MSKTSGHHRICADRGVNKAADFPQAFDKWGVAAGFGDGSGHSSDRVGGCSRDEGPMPEAWNRSGIAGWAASKADVSDVSQGW